MREGVSPLAFAAFAESVALRARTLDVLEALQALKDTDWQVRTAAAVALEEMGPRAAKAVPVLIQTLEQDKREEVRRAAAEALGSIRPATVDATSALTRAVEDPSAYVRWAAARALSAITERRESRYPRPICVSG
jgi:HEAT repeat protein